MRGHFLRAATGNGGGGGLGPIDWTLVGVSAFVASTATAISPTVPAGCQDGDLLVSVVASRKDPVFTPPDGWGLATSQSSGTSLAGSTNSVSSIALAWTVHGASAPSTEWTLSVTPSIALSSIVAYRPSAGTPELVEASSATLGAPGTVPTTASLTTDEEDCLIVAGFSGARVTGADLFLAATDPATPSGSTDVVTAPTRGTWIERLDNASTTGADVTLAIAEAVKQLAGATGTIQCTASLNARHAIASAAFRAA